MKALDFFFSAITYDTGVSFKTSKKQEIQINDMKMHKNYLLIGPVLCLALTPTPNTQMASTQHAYKTGKCERYTLGMQYFSSGSFSARSSRRKQRFFGVFQHHVPRTAPLLVDARELLKGAAHSTDRCSRSSTSAPMTSPRQGRDASMTSPKKVLLIRNGIVRFFSNTRHNSNLSV